MLTFIYFIFYSALQNTFPGQLYLDNKYSDSDSKQQQQQQQQQQTTTASRKKKTEK